MKKKNVLIAACVFVAVMVVICFAHLAGATFNETAWSLLPPVVAIGLALITKEAYSSLFIGVVLGAYMTAECNFVGTMDALTVDALSAAIADTAGIFLFLVILGVIVALINKSGASRAFGEWAQKHIKTKAGALLATFVLGVLIFIDDYFNCLTVGSVMAPVTDSKKISRVKLAYIIDATAAPVCMIAPISSWAAAVSSSVEGCENYSEMQLFLRAIPYNFYSILTFVFILTIIFMGIDYGKMADFELKAEKEGDLAILDVSLTDEKQERKIEEEGPANPHKGKIIDLVLPIVILIAFAVWGLIKNGFDTMAADGIEGNWTVAFSNTDAYVGLPWGSIIALVIFIVYLVLRKVVTFEEAMECIPKGFIAMVPAITILTLATSLKYMTQGLGVKMFVKGVMENATGLNWALPAIVFVVACLIAFATGTSWGTFGILIPIVQVVFPETSPLFFVGISACLAGAVCGDHCSPISDTTIMSSAGAHCNHIAHVETQLPYAVSVAAISFVCYIIAGLFANLNATWVSIPVGVVLVVAFLFVMKVKTAKKKA